MGILIRVLDRNFSDNSLPLLGDYGQIPAMGLLGLYKFVDGATYLQDSSGNGKTLTVQSNNTGGALPSFDAGGLLMPDIAATGKYSTVSTGIDTDTNFTSIKVFSPRAARLMYVDANDNSAGLNSNYTPTGFNYQFSNGANRTGAIGAIAVASPSYVYHVLASDGASIYGGVNGTQVSPVTFASLGGVPTNTGTGLRFGNVNSSQGLAAHIVFWAIWGRLLTPAEFTNVYRGVKKFVTASKTGVNLP